MALQLAQELDKYLKATDLCDIDNPALRDQARAIIQGAETAMYSSAALDVKLGCYGAWAEVSGHGWPNWKKAHRYRSGEESRQTSRVKLLN